MQKSHLNANKHLVTLITYLTKQHVIQQTANLGADCLKEGSDKLSLAVEEAEVDENAHLMASISNMITPTKMASISLEEAGASIMQKEQPATVGEHLITCGESLKLLSVMVTAIDPESEEGTLSGQRMLYASEQMILAGKELMGEKKEKPKGKAWIKG